MGHAVEGTPVEYTPLARKRLQRGGACARAQRLRVSGQPLGGAPLMGRASEGTPSGYPPPACKHLQRGGACARAQHLRVSGQPLGGAPLLASALPPRGRH